VGVSPSDNAAIRAAENLPAQAFEDPDRTMWVNSYTEDAIAAGPGSPTIDGRAALLAVVPQIAVSSLEIVADSTIGARRPRRYPWPRDLAVVCRGSSRPRQTRGEVGSCSATT
jgi:hypothetical protein